MGAESLGAALRAARRERGWSQSEAARELAALGRARAAPTASLASLKTQLSRWENGHARPEPLYRHLLAELYRSAELAAGPEPEPPEDATERLRALLAEADAVGDDALALLRTQFEATRRLDDRLGAAGSGATVRAQVEQLARLLAHTLVHTRRRVVAAMLAEAALLAGWQALDQDRPDESFARHEQARHAAREAAAPALLGQALAGQSAVLLELGLPGPALTVLEAAPADGPGAAWAAMARGAARAAAGDTTESHVAFTAAERVIRAAPGPPDLVQRGWALDYDGLHRRRSAALARHGDAEALAGLRAAAAGDRLPVREQATLRADLAFALADRGAAEDAAEHARHARILATRIGSHRVRHRLDRLPVTRAGG
ncbi:hypothetical protein ACFQE5_20600 [Pseudonocardia hispaniensis]|uniref:HTH cro/C1-type domain-containing protein n=1 Tax=Pseudonocardia hispaniensis TaxID=904933 RepID=A0ABW1J6W0_9PSEU